MNSLSWFLYLINVVSGIKLLGMVLAGIFSGILALAAISVAVSEGETWDWFTRNARWLILSPIVAWTLVIFIPGQQTLYAIAASQVGEQVIKSEAVQGVANDSLLALRGWLKKQITEAKPVSQ